ncbi:hypothetical protein [Aureivirga sp. CE67]|uniref:hypothetical protein n=1 Tax=Aureivirga sp. CE67 TaxID=1788983 RepID=UPI0018CB9362|nr:hypothetical protein [Aureivirga sp. CE67]
MQNKIKIFLGLFFLVINTSFFSKNRYDKRIDISTDTLRNSLVFIKESTKLDVKSRKIIEEDLKQFLKIKPKISLIFYVCYNENSRFLIFKRIITIKDALEEIGISSDKISYVFEENNDSSCHIDIFTFDLIPPRSSSNE